jgi:transposase-like protein
MMYVRFPLSLRNVEDLLVERGIDICHQTARHWWNRFDPCLQQIFGGSASAECVVSITGSGMSRRCT